MQSERELEESRTKCTKCGWIRVHKGIRAERKRRLNHRRPYRPSKGYGLPFCRKHWTVLVGKVEDSPWIGWAVTSTSRIYFLFTFHGHGYRSAMTFLCVLPFRYHAEQPCPKAGRKSKKDGFTSAENWPRSLHWHQITPQVTMTSGCVLFLLRIPMNRYREYIPKKKEESGDCKGTIF